MSKQFKKDTNDLFKMWIVKLPFVTQRRLNRTGQNKWEAMQSSMFKRESLFSNGSAWCEMI